MFVASCSLMLQITVPCAVEQWKMFCKETVQKWNFKRWIEEFIATACDKKQSSTYEKPNYYFFGIVSISWPGHFIGKHGEKLIWGGGVIPWTTEIF
jgi:hypothetical protein